MKKFKNLIEKTILRDYEDIIYTINNSIKNIGILSYNKSNISDSYIQEELSELKIKEEKYNFLIDLINNNIEKNENYIPKNNKYCHYKNNDVLNVCPYWTTNPFALSKDDGYCFFLGYGDKELEDIGTLCEQIKICSIK
jgi:hypothetical protein